jgi:hypothetical protein
LVAIIDELAVPGKLILAAANITVSDAMPTDVPETLDFSEPYSVDVIATQEPSVAARYVRLFVVSASNILSLDFHR